MAKPGFFDYLSAAFNARPFGMFVAPNWIGLAAVGLLGLANPGFWVLGAGLELGYLLLLATNSRFQRTVAAQQLSGSRGDWSERLARLATRLTETERRRYEAFAARCRSIISLQMHGSELVPAGLDSQASSLSRLAWMYLRLLVARHVIQDVLSAAHGDGSRDLAQRQAKLERQLQDDSLDPELRRSLTGQLEILRQRVEQRGEAARKFDYIDAELTRIEEQAELIREQAALSTDPDLLSQRIDEIAATLSGTSQWIRDQQQLYGAMDDLLTDMPPMTMAPRARETQ
jgi:hypothetical protein